ncbi:MAG: stage II sporulation protein P [Sporolactobacillus sp.]|nr:stage II sporulation protein P [Sporolactobacillus sp.]MCI1882710.1 stage II sporulation protein P [Sporolactobacillus sp.]
MNKHSSTYHLPKSGKLLLYYLLLSLAAYLLAALITAGQWKLAAVDDAMQKADWSPGLLFSETIGHENALLGHVVRASERPKGLYRLIFEAMTGLHFDDIRSLFGTELPGFTIYNTKIFDAGEGLNYNNLPRDDPPEISMETPSHPPAEKKAEEKPKVGTNVKKTVLIYHTHFWESYKPANKGLDSNYKQPDVTVFRDGRIITQVLQKQGIGVEHVYRRGWEYDEAYTYSRRLVQEMLKKIPSLDVLIDIHRDSAGRNWTTTTIDKKPYARISFIIGEANPNYTSNLYLARQLKKSLDHDYPGLVRGIVGKTKYTGNGVYNQDLSKDALLIEIGGVDNTLAEVDRSADAFAHALADRLSGQKK